MRRTRCTTWLGLPLLVTLACAGEDAGSDTTDPSLDATTPMTPTGPAQTSGMPGGAEPNTPGDTSPGPMTTPPTPAGPGDTPPGDPMVTPPATPADEPEPVGAPVGGNGGSDPVDTPETPDTPDTPQPEPDPVTNGGAGPAAGGSGPGPATPTDCTLDVTSSVSEFIATVGIVEFTTDLAGVTGARIDFGLDTNYGMTAPVDLEEPSYRTLLLGMKPSQEYHFRVTVEGASGECQSDDFTIETGPRPNNLPNIEITTEDGAALAGGFMVTGTYQGGPAYILDSDGDFVWWQAEGEVTRARMSYDGKHMWIAKGNVPEGQAKVVRVRMDGSEREDLSQEFARLNHDLTVLPDETVIFIAYGDNGCDDIIERSPDGTTRVIANSGDVLGTNSCHCNALHYSAEDDTVVVSELNASAYFKVQRDGTVVWILGGGGANDFTGAGSSWNRQHGFHLLGLDRMVIFNNGQTGGGVSLAIEIALNLGDMTATRDWEYESQEGLTNDIMGDVQRLYNGNTLITYSQRGIVHEVDSMGNLLQAMSWGIGGAIGYVMKRESLYGPPPK